MLVSVCLYELIFNSFVFLFYFPGLFCISFVISPAYYLRGGEISLINLRRFLPGDTYIYIYIYTHTFTFTFTLIHAVLQRLFFVGPTCSCNFFLVCNKGVVKHLKPLTKYTNQNTFFEQTKMLLTCVYYCIGKPWFRIKSRSVKQSS
jgi:hypothetical protein